MATNPDTRTAVTNRKPNTHQLAAALGVDAELLVRFVEEHPRPTPAIILGWANAEPDKLLDDVEEWLAFYKHRKARSEPTAISVDDLPDDHRIGPKEGWGQ